MAAQYSIGPLVVGFSLLSVARPAWGGQPALPGEGGTISESAAADPVPDPPADGTDGTGGASADASATDSTFNDDFDDTAAPDPVDAPADTGESLEDDGAEVSPAGDSDIVAAQTGLIDPFKGRLAVGAIHTIAGMNGINVRYFLSDHFAIGGSAGVALFAYKEDDPSTTDCPGPDCTFENSRTVAAMGFNIEALYFAKLGREAGHLPFRADFGLGGRFGLLSVVNATDVADNLDDPTELHIEIPLIFQLMFGNNFAISPELGMDFRIIPGSREKGDANEGSQLPPGGGTRGPGFGWDITPGIGLFGGVSLHYIFGGK